SAIYSAVARLLARRHPPGATEVLLRHLPDAYGSTTSEDVLEALLSLNKRSSKPDPVLLAALHDSVPARRAAAGYLLGRRRGADIRQWGAKRLADGDAVVRPRAALGLASGNEKKAIPVLIDLLAEPGGELAWPAEDLLLRLAAEQSPAPPAAAGTAEARKK